MSDMYFPHLYNGRDDISLKVLLGKVNRYKYPGVSLDTQQAIDKQWVYCYSILCYHSCIIVVFFLFLPVPFTLSFSS